MPRCSCVAQPLYALLNSTQPDPAEWIAEKAINALKSALAQAPAVGHPNYKLPRLIFMHEERELTLGILT